MQIPKAFPFLDCHKFNILIHVIVICGVINWQIVWINYQFDLNFLMIGSEDEELFGHLEYFSSHLGGLNRKLSYCN